MAPRARPCNPLRPVAAVRVAVERPGSGPGARRAARWGIASSIRFMPAVRGIDHTCFTVSDLDRAIAFYGDVLGCEVLSVRERHGGAVAAIVGYPDAHVRMADLRAPSGDHVIELFEYVDPAVEHAPIAPRVVGCAHLCFLVDDLPRVYEELRADGVDSFFSAPVEITEGSGAGGRAVYLRDPDGIVVELYQPPPGR